MRHANRRLRLLVAVFAVVFLAAFVRVAWLQAVKAQALDHLAASQQRKEIAVTARRGTIFDRNLARLPAGRPGREPRRGRASPAASSGSSSSPRF